VAAERSKQHNLSVTAASSSRISFDVAHFFASAAKLSLSSVSLGFSVGAGARAAVCACGEGQ
jgi:hypothetical protein